MWPNADHENNARSRHLGLKHYGFAGLTLASDIELPIAFADPEADGIELTLRDGGSTRGLPARWTSAERMHPMDVDDGGLELCRDGAELLLRYMGSFDLILDPNSRSASFHRHPEADNATVEHLLLDQAIPRMLGHFGHLMLHASAVDIDGRALCFVAPSGAGKSTLAALLANAGHPVLADDVVRITSGVDGVQVFPGYPSLRLWADSAPLLATDQVVAHAAMAIYSSKRNYRLRPTSRAEGMRPLGALILLAAQGENGATSPGMRSIAPAAALMRLMGQCFGLHTADGDRLADRLRRMAAVCARARPLELAFRHDYAINRSLLDALRPLLTPE